MSFPRPARARWLTALTLTLAASACSDAPSGPAHGSRADTRERSHAVPASVTWNATGREIVAVRGASAVQQARIFAYLSVAQYDAILAAEDAKARGRHPSATAAAAAASVVVLKSFFGADDGLLESRLVAQRATSADSPREFAAGEAIGRAIGAQVVRMAETDRNGLMAAPPNPGGFGSWTSTNPIRGLIGVRTFALTSDDQFRSPPPPAYMSQEYNAALKEVRAMSDTGNAAMLTIAQFWAANGPAYLNKVASDLLVDHERSERKAARVLALANMALFDATDACFDAKLAYYYIRPSQADPLIRLRVALPNHPSYPSGHSCQTGAVMTVLQHVFPSRSDELQAMIEEAGMARMYGGLHYRFDLLAGREIGRRVAEYVIRVGPRGHEPVPIVTQ
jgi:membrane-associated phospholipid phosphatase